MTLSVLPWWLPLSVFVWAVQMVAFHAAGYLFETWENAADYNTFNHLSASSNPRVACS